jgi:uroporphyrinogen III methyltransferase/synthase
VKPLVYLIGAGPGAPDLISARGLSCLHAADVVIYDRLVHRRLVEAAPRDAERIEVGSAAPLPAAQEAICYLLAEKAREGKVVARLKWGDAFVFDRGGEEALFLHEQGIAFDVIPGVPAAVGVPAYAGIPVTYPGGGDTVTFVRGYEDDRREKPRVNWESLARLDGTIVCYAGPKQLPHMLAALLSHGRADEESAAVIVNGTLPSQRTISGTLGELAAQARAHTIAGPAVLVVGKVVGFREHLRWFDNRPLFGRRVLVTASADQSRELVERLEREGAEPVRAPVVQIAPLDDPAPLDEACAEIGRFDWIVFTAANSVSILLARLLQGSRDIRALAGPRICAAGPGTASALARVGITPDLIPAEQTTAGLVRSLRSAASLAGARILIPRSDIAGHALATGLREAGATVADIAAYRVVTLGSDAQLDVYRQLLDRRIDVVTFTSGYAIQAFLAIHGADQAVDLLNGTVVATIGAEALHAALQARISPAIAPTGSTIAELVEGVVGHFGRVQSAKFKVQS